LETIDTINGKNYEYLCEEKNCVMSIFNGETNTSSINKRQQESRGTGRLLMVKEEMEVRYWAL